MQRQEVVSLHTWRISSPTSSVWFPRMLAAGCSEAGAVSSGAATGTNDEASADLSTAGALLGFT